MDIQDIEGTGGTGLAGEGPAAAGERVLALADPRARRVELSGGKAASLARAAEAGLPVPPGFVVPPPSAQPTPHGRELYAAWRELSAEGTRPLAVRSSSAAEDTVTSSMAGRFRTVLDVRGWEEFRAALREVRGSSAREPAVLVQPMVRSRVGGVLFTSDPLPGGARRMLVSAVRGGPDRLVGGAETGSDFRLTRHGRPVGGAPAAGLLTGRELRRLAALARRARRLFGRAQDIEFGFDALTGRLWLFQSRPITARAPRPARRARLLGAGPVAETLPGVLHPLEEDLWVTPMAHGLAAALHLCGAASARTLRGVPAVTTVAGRAVADLRLLGLAGPRHRLLAALDPLPAARRLAAAWRVGRLRAALPGLALALRAEVDAQLAAAPAAGELSPAALAAALRWSRAVLVPLHAQEALAGALPAPPEAPAAARPRRRRAPAARVAASGPGGAAAGAAGDAAGAPPATGAGVALAALAAARAAGEEEAAIPARHPEVLALIPPSLTTPPRPPAAWPAGTVPGAIPDSVPETVPGTAPGAIPGTTSGAIPDTAPDTAPGAVPDTAPRAIPDTDPDSAAGWQEIAAALAGLPLREALRLRVRWVQEFQAALVRELAARHPGPEPLALLRWEELLALAEGGRRPAGANRRTPPPQGPPPPDAFRLAADGTPVPEPRRGGRAAGAGRPVSGGRVHGLAWDGAGPPPPGAVLVVRTLDPGLAPLLPGLTGLVAQTGSPLSHLALLARESGLAAVTGVPGAVDRFPPGTPLLVDGATGEVRAR
ncbi:PEP/pyruvate-binding domain-containing protein [Streptomyces hoynatensis]|uniref:Pyruvate phosphate dikinase n=1 Tax=Streptomyces hoynatensis TaxID=1141874 RepID=A0A3A9ZIY2_9ACTN|nr:PEP/pyruvate-binding domain-containing protein [Streptomyces hoynatensis]RKN47176.1 pyruvate phosphate dikinase [Streptomyces hoynatensis]